MGLLFTEKESQLKRSPSIPTEKESQLSLFPSFSPNAALCESSTRGLTDVGFEDTLTELNSE